MSHGWGTFDPFLEGSVLPSTDPPCDCPLSTDLWPCGVSPRSGHWPCSVRPTGFMGSQAWSNLSGCPQWQHCSTQTSWPQVMPFKPGRWVRSGSPPGPAGGVLTITLSPLRVPQLLCSALAVRGGLPAARSSL